MVEWFRFSCVMVFVIGKKFEMKSWVIVVCLLGLGIGWSVFWLIGLLFVCFLGL